MRLTRMDGRQARDAILASGSRLVAPGVADKVIAFVAVSRFRPEGETVGETELSGLEIEPALLSIVCSELNNKRTGSAGRKSLRICSKARSRRSSGNSTNRAWPVSTRHCGCSSRSNC